MSLKNALKLQWKFPVGNDLVNLIQAGYANQRIASKLGVISDYNHFAHRADHGAQGLHDETVGIADTSFRDAADAHDQDVRRDAAQHFFADGSELHAQSRVKIAAGQNDLCPLAVPEGLSYRDGVGHDLNGPVAQTARDLDATGAATLSIDPAPGPRWTRAGTSGTRSSRYPVRGP